MFNTKTGVSTQSISLDKNLFLFSNSAGLNITLMSFIENTLILIKELIFQTCFFVDVIIIRNLK